ncbi:hypothetical protein [Aquabacterium sp.]|uniref:tetratricopeptide repeat protein n=1 Tax=Aquabacterium sp. TaxID=1872578 RepID=UPI0025C4632E|nr:hypothetical protein [Aquabacterium sp.]
MVGIAGPEGMDGADAQPLIATLNATLDASKDAAIRSPMRTPSLSLVLVFILLERGALCPSQARSLRSSDGPMNEAPPLEGVVICNQVKESVNHPPMGAGSYFEFGFNPACRLMPKCFRGNDKDQTGSSRLSLAFVRRGMCCAVMVSVLSALTACSSTPKKDDVAARLAVQEQVNENLAAADKAQKQGNTEQAMVQLDQAIKADPSSKAPWLKKAQIHFDAHQYGPAITESQEVLQRDVNDLTAKSILAVSGLRVSALALEQLRKANEVNGSTRSEAESVAKLIREALGEPILVPQPVAAASEPVKAKTAAKSQPRAVLAAASAVPAVPRTNSAPAAAPALAQPVKSTPPATTARAAGASGGRNNPFGALQ